VEYDRKRANGDKSKRNVMLSLKRMRAIAAGIDAMIEKHQAQGQFEFVGEG